jgi:hypothetical protein
MPNLILYPDIHKEYLQTNCSRRQSCWKRKTARISFVNAGSLTAPASGVKDGAHLASNRLNSMSEKLDGDSGTFDAVSTEL